MKDETIFATSQIAVNVHSAKSEIYITSNGFPLHYSTIRSVGIKHLKGYENNFLIVEFYEPITYLRTISGEKHSFSSVALLPQDGVPANKITMNWMQKEFSAISKWINRCLRAELERRDKQ